MISAEDTARRAVQAPWDEDENKAPSAETGGGLTASTKLGGGMG
jgi:hypothetical protein